MTRAGVIANRPSRATQDPRARCRSTPAPRSHPDAATPRASGHAIGGVRRVERAARGGPRGGQRWLGALGAGRGTFMTTPPVDPVLAMWVRIRIATIFDHAIFETSLSKG